MNSINSRRLALAMLFCILLPLAALAQSTTAGAIGGTVSDQHKAVVPNAKITVQNLETHEQKTGISDGQGKFRITTLSPGQYEVKIEAPLFAPYRLSGVIVEVGRVTSIEIGLSLGGAVATVEVTDEAPAVNTVQPDFASNINSTAIENLPINGRKWSNFAILTPGVVPDGPYGLLSFRGISGLLNMHTVDGGNNNDAFWSEERGRTRMAHTISQSSVREFQVNNSNFSAEYGRAAGGVINTVTKSGSDNLHGQAFYYIRDNDVLGAVNPFSTEYTDNSGTITSQPVKPLDRRQQFGGNLGGPIIKDKLYWFFNYEGQRVNFAGVAAPSGSSFFSPATTQTTLSNTATPLGSRPISTRLPTTLAFAAAPVAATFPRPYRARCRAITPPPRTSCSPKPGLFRAAAIRTSSSPSSIGTSTAKTPSPSAITACAGALPTACRPFPFTTMASPVGAATTSRPIWPWVACARL